MSVITLNQTFTKSELIKECETEIKYREYVYGNKVEQGKMKSYEKDTKINRMKAIREILIGLEKQEKLSSNLFTTNPN